MVSTYMCSTVLSLTYSLTWSCKNNEEIHTVNTTWWIILNTKIDMFFDTKTEVTFFTKSTFWEFITNNSQCFFENFLSLITTDCNFTWDLLTSTNTELSNCKSWFTICWFLISKLFKNSCGLCNIITFTTNTWVDYKFFNFYFLHWIYFTHLNRMK